jgi:hypothetical protein
MKIYYILIMFLGISITTVAQNVAYSKLEPFSKSQNPPEFEIIGKVKDNLLIYQFDKNHYIKIYDNDMNQINEVKLKFLSSDINGVKFLNHINFCYVVWKKIKDKAIVYEYAKINNNGELQGVIVSLDTINLGNQSAIEFYSKMLNFVISEDKSKIALSKIGMSKDTLEISATIFDADFNVLEKSTMKLANHNADTDFFNDVLVNNKGDIIFSFSNNFNGQLVNYFQIFVKKINIKKLYNANLPIDKIHVVNPTITIDNNNEEYLINAFSIDTINNKTHIEGFYSAKVSFNQSSETKNVLYAKHVSFSKFPQNDTDFTLFDSKIFMEKDSKVFMKKDGSYFIITENNYKDFNLKYNYDVNNAYNNNYFTASNNEINMNTPFFRTFSKNELDVYLNIDVGEGSKTSKSSYVNTNIYYEPDISLKPSNTFNSVNTPMINDRVFYRVIKNIKDANRQIAILNISKDGNLQNDTIIKIPENIEFKMQEVSFLRSNITTNFFTVLKEEDNFNLIFFSKDLNNQLLLNKYKISNKADNIEMNVIKARYDYYFFAIMSTKQESKNELIIPFFRHNKMGFAKIY